MKVTGIITEYNPFHQGHIHHLQEARKATGCDLLIAVVSDWFTQRGLPSLMSPRKKAQLAVAHGADIVLALPAFQAAQSARHFAQAAVQALAQAGADTIVFGSETCDRERLETLAEAEILPDAATSQARNSPDLGPNDLLAVEYIRAAKPCSLSCLPIRRDPSFVSATQSRKDFLAGKPVWNQEWMDPAQTWESYWPTLRNALLLTSAEDLAQFHLVTEGIEHRLKKAALEQKSWEGFLEAAISKTYTRARIQRTCVMILLQVKKNFVQEHTSYASNQVLAFSDAGKAWLRHKDFVLRSRDLPGWLKDFQFKTRTLYERMGAHEKKQDV